MSLPGCFHCTSHGICTFFQQTGDRKYSIFRLIFHGMESSELNPCSEWRCLRSGWAGLTPPPEPWASARIRIPRNYSQKYPHSWSADHPSLHLSGRHQPHPPGTLGIFLFQTDIFQNLWRRDGDIPGFLWLHFQPFIHGDGTAHPRDFLGIPAHPSSGKRAAPSMPFPALGLGNGIFHKDVEQIKFPAGSEEMNLVLNTGKQGEPAWRFIPGIPGLFLGSSQHYQLVASRHHKFTPEIISSRCSLLREERRAPANKNIVSVGNYSFRTTGKTEFLQFIHSAGAWSHGFFFSSGHWGFLFQIHFAALFLFSFLFFIFIFIFNFNFNLYFYFY